MSCTPVDRHQHKVWGRIQGMDGNGQGSSSGGSDVEHRCAAGSQSAAAVEPQTADVSCMPVDQDQHRALGRTECMDGNGLAWPLCKDDNETASLKKC